jgi:serine/threonine protein kinase
VEDKVVGRGCFGYVKKAKLRRGQEMTDVAVKFIHMSTMSKNLVDEEALMMVKLKHKFVVEIFGIIDVGKMTAIVMEYMKLGALDAYLRENKADYIDDKNELLDWCEDVARAMAWLEKSSYFHGDLAARNVLLRRDGEDKIAKISDFGLASYTIGAPVDITKNIPFRWCAPEVIKGGSKMCLQSDIWAFGVLLWEVFALGELPYGLMTNQYIAEVIDVERLQKPRKCPEEVYKLMMDCWAIDPTGRPDFKTIKERLVDMGDSDSEDSDSDSDSD